MQRTQECTTIKTNKTHKSLPKMNKRGSKPLRGNFQAVYQVLHKLTVFSNGFKT